MPNFDPAFSARIADCYESARTALLAERNAAGHWTGELSTSALSTATAIMAVEMVRRDCLGKTDSHPSANLPAIPTDERLRSLIVGGLEWLVRNQNEDGGWGDTTKSISNISTTMLAHASFHATGRNEEYAQTVETARKYIDRIGGVQAVIDRYGKDKTFSIPILTHCALAGLVEWKNVKPLPFELACLSSRFYKTVQLPVVSYALPALIAIGQVRHHFRKPWNPLMRLLRKLAVRPSLRKLESIQPSNGGFLEAAPLTSFVTMSLAGMGLSSHAVARRGIDFLVKSVRSDGSWPIDTNLATWVTTLSVNAVRGNLPENEKLPVRKWLLDQQYQVVHPYTDAAPGGWAWTDLPGGVPDADDTPGAVLALLNLRNGCSADEIPETERKQISNALGWLLDLQNRDYGWPTFCRGWGALPFDRSAPDLSAHALRAFLAWRNHPVSVGASEKFRQRILRAVETGFIYLERTQRADGSWLPLWFGNQYEQNDENPTYGTARVLAAYRDAGRLDTEPAERGIQWLQNAQNSDGGWGGGANIPSSVEETALAVDVLVETASHSDVTFRGLEWLLGQVESKRYTETTPIGFYFAKLWYFEKLYPQSFMVAALDRAARCFCAENTSVTVGQIEERQKQATAG